MAYLPLIPISPKYRFGITSNHQIPNEKSTSSFPNIYLYGIRNKGSEVLLRELSHPY